MSEPKAQTERGELVVRISSDLEKKTMRMEFNMPVRYMVFTKLDAIAFARSFIGHVKRLKNG